MPAPLRLLPQYKPRLWGGRRLAPDSPEPIGEAWFAHDSLPLLIKILDTADWLSLQLHPDDAQARRLEGPGAVGKAEAWHILEAAPGAQVISGLRPAATRTDLERALLQGTLLDLVQRVDVKPGDTLYNPPGLIHALGPGLLVYEVQQKSDITYRLWDWDRPPSPDRPLHIDQSLACARVDAQPVISQAQSGRVATCRHFTLDLATFETCRVDIPASHAVTAIADSALHCDAWHERIGPFGTLLIPPRAGPYQVRGRALVAARP